jgi:hypothetical protein
VDPAESNALLTQEDMDYMESHGIAPSEEYLASLRMGETVTDPQVATHGTFAYVRITTDLILIETALSASAPPVRPVGLDPTAHLSQDQQAQYGPIPIRSLGDGHRPEPAGSPSKVVSPQNKRTRKRKRSDSDVEQGWLDILKKNPRFAKPLDPKGTTWAADYLIKGSRLPRPGGKGETTYAVKWVGWPGSTREPKKNVPPRLIAAYLDS